MAQNIGHSMVVRVLSVVFIDSYNNSFENFVRQSLFEKQFFASYEGPGVLPLLEDSI